MNYMSEEAMAYRHFGPKKQQRTSEELEAENAVLKDEIHRHEEVFQFSANKIAALKMENDALLVALFDLHEATKCFDITHPEETSDVLFRARVAIGHGRLGEMQTKALLAQEQEDE